MINREYPYSELTEKIISCFFKVHNTLGPGFLENVYRNALVIELKKQGFECEVEKEVRINYEGEEVGIHRLDILVEGNIIIETKTVNELHPKHITQVKSYLAATKYPVGLLVNFANESVEWKRIQPRFKS